MNTITFKTEKNELEAKKHVYVTPEFFAMPLRYQFRGVWNLIRQIIKYI
jgi:hypothetical protein